MSAATPPPAPPAGSSAAPAAPLALAGPGAHETCPFCQASALVVPSRRLRYVCAVCGRARVPIDDAAIERQGGELEALDEATRAERASQLWRGFGILVAFLGAATALVFVSFLVLVHPPLGAALFSGLFALAPSTLAAWAFRRSRQNANRVGPALERGWDTVAAELLARRPSTTEAQLAALLRLKPAQAEAMLVRLSAAGLVGSRLTDAGELTFHPTGRARIAAGLADDPIVPTIEAAAPKARVATPAALSNADAMPADRERERDALAERERAAFEERERAELEAALDEAEATRRESARREP
ncbi:MAG: hypothetical protein MUF34_17930 [Polyangiaceae bacterium]|nr:hypothetical protein [Polyangiaceae bacterium]